MPAAEQFDEGLPRSLAGLLPGVSAAGYDEGLAADHARKVDLMWEEWRPLAEGVTRECTSFWV